MHDCENILTRLSLHLDRQLSPDQFAALQADVQDCPQCRAMFQAMQRADGAMRRSPLLTPRSDLSAAVLERIEQLQARDRKLLGITLLVGGALSLGPSLVIGFGLLIAVLTAIQPDILQGLIGLLVDGLSTAYAFTLAFDTMQHVLGAWIVPSLTALFGVVLLALTVLWAARLTMTPRFLKA